MVEEKEGADQITNSLKDVLRSAGKSINGETGYDQILSMVTELIKCGEKVGVEKGDDFEKGY